MIVVVFIVLLWIACSKIYTYKKSEGIRFVKNMGAGWNLGNSLDVSGKGEINALPEVYELFWGNPLTTKAMIDVVKASGFNTVRIPITWYEHMDENGIIDEKWMYRVQEVVDYVIDNDMYAIIDVHHDKWFMLTYENEENAEKVLHSTWLQIAQHFASYDERLIFEAMNEPRLFDTEFEWNAGTKEARAVLNNLNAAFVNVIRTSHSQNANRYLMVAPYCNSSDEEALDDFKLPKDERIIISIHEYVPYEFTMKADGTSIWSKDNKKDTQKIDQVFDRLYQNFIRKGIPVIISEFGAVDKNNLESRLEWTNYYVSAAREKKIMCIWWDEGSKEDEKGRYKLLNRYTLKWEHPKIVKTLVQK